jgi:GNAT superfamily N-acetyltransferase
LIGHGGAIPTELAFWGQRRLALWYVDLALLPEFQGTGLGKRLTSVWMQLCPNQLGFNANSKSAVVLRRLGWEPGPYARRCALPINIDRMVANRLGLAASAAAKAVTAPYRLALRAWVRSAPTLAPESIPEDHGELDRLFQPPDGVELTIVRDTQWVRWRIIDSPFFDSYRLFRVAESAALVRGVVWDGQRRLHILFVDRKADARLRRELLRGIIKWALGRGVDLVWTVVNGRAMLAELKSLLPSHAPVCFVAASDDAAMLAAIRGEDYEMHGVDCDSDVMYVPDHGSSVEW